MKQAILFALLSVVLILSSCGPKNSPAYGYFPAAGWDGTALVHTKYGLIRGKAGESNTFVWKGIPYAKPPVGELRWKAPRDARPWYGVLNADHFGNSAPQMFSIFFKFTYGSEDCLYLNVWRPRTAQKDLPVYVYIHGGGNSIGSADNENYYGFTLANSMNAVYVSINYRLGPLGWFRHPSLDQDVSPLDASGNYGTLDIIQALKWVRANIGSFGGSTNRVIVAGESAGAIDILSLLISPLAKGLFDGAVIESGIDVANTPEAADQFGEETLEKLLVRDRKGKDTDDAKTRIAAMSPAKVRNYLYSKTPDALIRVQKPWVFGMLTMPYIYEDGTVIPKGGFKSLREGTYPVKVPLLIGSNRDEYKLFLKLERRHPWNSDIYRAKAEFMSLNWKNRGVDSIARALSTAKGQPPVFVYRFDWGAEDENGKSVLPGKMGQSIGACHSLEIPFFMGSGKPAIGFLVGGLFTGQNREGREKLTAVMMRYLNSFVHTGDPNGNGLIPWPSWSNEAGKNKGIVFDADDKNLRLSYLTDAVTLPGILAKMKKELKEPVLSEVMESVTNWMQRR